MKERLKITTKYVDLYTVSLKLINFQPIKTDVHELNLYNVERHWSTLANSNSTCARKMTT
jgi:hypothetical protein